MDMRAFTARGMLNIPTPGKIIKPQKTAFIIKECFCTEGHNLISSRVSFDGHHGILLKARRGKNAGLIALSPICGQKNRIDYGITLAENDLLVLKCPICKTRLPIYSPCECGASMVTFFLDRINSFTNCIGVCNRVGCKHAVIVMQHELSVCSGLDQW
jgi:hypothetical protein